MFGLSPVQLLICGVVAVLLFGSRLPSVARSLGKSLTEFRRGMQDLQHEFNDAMRESDREASGSTPSLTDNTANLHDDSAPDEIYDPRPEETVAEEMTEDDEMIEDAGAATEASESEAPAAAVSEEEKQDAAS